MKRIVAGLVIACAVGRSAGAQVPALLTESRMIMQIGDMAPDTSIVRTISAGKRHRLEFTGHPMASMDPYTGKSTVQLLSFVDSDMTIDYLDVDAKAYTEMKPLQLMKKSKEMMAAMGVEMKVESTADTVSVDSLSDTRVVLGYRTLHFRAVSAHYFRMSVMGENGNWSLRQTIDAYVAPDAKPLIAGLTDSLVTTAGSGGIMGALGGAMMPGMDSVMRNVVGKTARISAAGVPLNSVMEMETVGEGQPRSRMRQTVEVLKMERISVPESTFTVPTNYKKREIPFPGGPVRN